LAVLAQDKPPGHHPGTLRWREEFAGCHRNVYVADGARGHPG